MAKGINKVILVGHLGADPDMRSLPNGDPVANMSLATSETWNDKQSGENREKTEWHRIVAYKKLAEIIGQYCRKGSKLYIEGRLQTRKWTDNHSVERYTTEIIASDMQMLDSKSDGGNYPPPQGSKQPPSAINYKDNEYAKQKGGHQRRPPPKNQQPHEQDDDEIPF